MPSALSEDAASPASLDHPKTEAAPPHPGAPPEQLGGSPRPQEPGSGRPKVEGGPLSTTRRFAFREGGRTVGAGVVAKLL